MDRDDCTARMAEISVEVGEIDRKHRPSKDDERRVRDLSEEFDAVKTHRARLDEKRNGPSGVFRTIPGSIVDDDHDGGRGRELHGGDQSLRSQARRTLDTLVGSDQLDARAAETVDRLTVTGPRSERDFAARMIQATGDDTYFRAFSRLMADPARGHLLWSPEEQTAFQTVQQLRSERSMTLL